MYIQNYKMNGRPPVYEQKSMNYLSIVPIISDLKLLRKSFHHQNAQLMF